MNKLKPAINKLKINILPLFLVLTIFTANAQENDSVNTANQDSISPVAPVSDTIKTPISGIKRDSISAAFQAQDTIPEIKEV